MLSVLGLARNLKAAALRSKPILVSLFIVGDMRAGLESRLGRRGTKIGSSHAGLTIEQSLAYIYAVYADYLRYGSLQPNDLKDARILEVGPGDNLGVAILFLAAGAREVVCLDRFHYELNSAQHERIYRALIASLDERQRAAVEGAVQLDGTDEVQFDPKRLRIVFGVGIEAADTAVGPATFDLIISRSVLEHVYETDAAFRVMDRLLRPGGRMLHKVDFRDHGIFSSAGRNELTFLTIPDRLWWLMTHNSGAPNRRLLEYYRAKVREIGYEAQLLVTILLGEQAELVPKRERLEPSDFGPKALRILREIRPKLVRRFRHLSDEDLIVAGVFLVAQKPGSAESLK
jgi:SAM-dependent methyltransferase